jgi:hypothetical protein
MDLQQPVDDLEPVELEPEAFWQMVAENWMGLMQCRRARMLRHESHHRRHRRGAGCFAGGRKSRATVFSLANLRDGRTRCRSGPA